MFFRRSGPTYIPCRDRDDGGGAQISAQISTMIYARLKGLVYAHTPLADVAHAPAGTRSEDWSEAWERFFSLGEGETPAKQLADLPEMQLPLPYRCDRAHPTATRRE